MADASSSTKQTVPAHPTDQGDVKSPLSSVPASAADAGAGYSTGCVSSHSTGASFDPALSLEQVRQLMSNFARERDWEQYHTPRNLLLALVGEVGELSEIFQWRGEVPPGLPGWSEADKTHLGEELSDVLLYLVRLSDRCGVDLASAVLKKLEKNALKYPAAQARGKSDKYTQYVQTTPAVPAAQLPTPAPAIAASAAAAAVLGTSASSPAPAQQ